MAALLTRLQGLYRDAEAATEAYDAAEEELTALTARTRRLTAELAGARDAAARARADAGRFARAQYRGRAPALPLPLRLLFARDARAALDGDRTLRRAAAVEAAAVARSARAERRADALAGAARKDLDRRQTLLARQRQARDTARLRLLEAAGILAALPPGELAALAELEASRADAPVGVPPPPWNRRRTCRVPGRTGPSAFPLRPGGGGGRAGYRSGRARGGGSRHGGGCRGSLLSRRRGGRHTASRPGARPPSPEPRRPRPDRRRVRRRPPPTPDRPPWRRGRRSSARSPTGR
ncbi:hypothetical protein [Streptomyces sp. CC228A]|uniref:hypothetical protein n=1 Tax=Streptomyces sp. CC228A TaxID=2898186 RepID=UPI001F3A40D1|nr:hypothetical protein [Streptomyces sp. CC228A]